MPGLHLVNRRQQVKHNPSLDLYYDQSGALLAARALDALAAWLSTQILQCYKFKLASPHPVQDAHIEPWKPYPQCIHLDYLTLTAP